MTARTVTLGAAWLVGMALMVAGCGGGPEPRTETAAAEAALLYDQLEIEHSLHRDREAIALARELLRDHPGFPDNDMATLLLVRSAARVGDAQAAVAAARDFPDRFPDSPLRGDVLQAGATAAWQAGERAAAVALWSLAYDAAPTPADRQTVAARLEDRLAVLEPAQLAAAFAASQATGAWPLVGRELIRAQLAAGEPGAAAGTLVTLEQAGATGPWVETAAAMVRGEIGLVEGVVAGRVGVLCPLTDRYAVLGNAFYAGAQLALAAVDPQREHGLELLVEDTAGDPVLGALAARKLCEKDGCVALVGALLSAPTAAAAIVAGYHGVPQISPTATNHRIGMLGPHVLQTNLTGNLEVQLLARLAHDVLLKQRFAILHPRTPEGEDLAAAFRAAVDSLGGRIVATASFPAEATDFREAVRTVKAERPEVLFVPATVDQMVLLGPQIDFYQVGALVMGPSGWNAAKLLRRAGSVMERAFTASDQMLFPGGWTGDFEAGWDRARYPEDATDLALSAYLATRLVLETMVETGIQQRAALQQALRERLPEAAVEVAGPGAFAGTVRVVEDGQWRPFPAELYAAGWAEQRRQLGLPALADSLAAPGDSAQAAADSTGAF